MTITIGETTYPTRKPKDVDAAMLAVTGCNAKETAAALGGTPLAGHVARALLPFLPEKDAPALVDLAQAIAAHGVTQVATDVRALLGGADEGALAEGVTAE